MGKVRVQPTTRGGMEEITMSTVLEPNVLRVPAPSPGPVPSASAPLDPTWLTATVRPAGSFGRSDTGRLRALLDALSACASIVVLDLQAARLRSTRAAAAIEDAAWDLERHGGCLLCINVDPESRACLAAAGDHTVLMDPAPAPVARG